MPQILSTEPISANGIVSIESPRSVSDTVGRVKAILSSNNVQLFALVDHSGEAEKVGLHMPDTKLLIFGNPKAGTPLMVAAPEIAIDLPLKILIHEDGNGKVWVSYNDPEYLRNRHNLSADLMQPLSAVAALAAAAVA